MKSILGENTGLLVEFTIPLRQNPADASESF